MTYVPTATVRRHVPSFCDPAARPWILTASILVSALGFIDGSVVSIAIPAMRETLGADLAQAQWISNAYMLPLSALILVGGAAGDRYGIARVLMAGLLVFMAASVLSAIATSPEALIAGRALKGAGAALMVPGSLALIARAYPAETRGRAIGTWAAASAVTTAVGPVLGGAALSLGSPEAWRVIFALNVPFGLLVIWILRTRVGNDPVRSTDPLDWTGAVLATLALGLGAYALTQLGEEGGIGPLPLAIGSVLAGAGFLLWQARAAHPMMPLDLFRNRVFASANALTFLLYFALGAVLFYLPMHVISAWNVTELEAAAAFAPLSVFIGALSARVGALADKHGARPLIALGSLIVGLSFVILGLTTPLRAFWTIVLPINCLMGFGMALVVGPLSTAVMGSVPDARSGAASGINNAVSRMAGLVAVAAMGSLAAVVYGGTGGDLSFGATNTSEAHIMASDAAFSAVAIVTGVLALFSAVVAWVGLKPVQSG